MMNKMDENGKPGLAIIIANKMGKKGKMEVEDEGGSENVEIAKDLLEAIKLEDAEKFAKLLESFIKLCE
jgi:hypothetical protein